MEIYETYRVHNILEVKRHASTPQKGSGQPKRNAYKIQDGQLWGVGD